jgi:acetylornithine deacetylase/succinyl-diaminopimelate desuccinylase-like protein
VARIAAVAPDLFFASKIEETLSSAGHDVTVVARAEAMPAGAELVIVDLDQVEPPFERPPGVPVLAFYSHVDVDTKRRGEQAGFDRVVPRSRMAREMPGLVEQLLGSRS